MPTDAPAPPDLTLERAYRARGLVRIAGVDEVGRGPLAGPVTAAAVLLDPACVPEGLADSKTLTAARRTELEAEIFAVAEVSVAHATVAEIDRLNILRAAHLAMCRALDGLTRPVCHALIDGNLIPREIRTPASAIVRGDARSLSIAAASIVAKCARDRIMVALAQHCPGYGWETNMGYPSPAHRDALSRLGASPHHRRSFAPVHNILCREVSVSL